MKEGFIWYTPNEPDVGDFFLSLSKESSLKDDLLDAFRTAVNNFLSLSKESSLKALFLSGPPGVGKSTAFYLFLKRVL